MGIVAGICLLMAATATADYYLSANQIFCNCGPTEAASYQTFTESENSCMGQTHGAGYGSCLGVQMGLLSADCRSQNVGDFKAMLGDRAEAYPYQNLDDTVGVLMQCVKNYMIGNCMQKALD